MNILGFVAMAPEDTGITIPASVNSEASAAAYLTVLNKQFAGNVFNFAHLALQHSGRLRTLLCALDLGSLCRQSGCERLP
ncbi:MAG: hypothetical protein VKL23_06280 [Cyanobacteriota bacterium]|nr:hypothetical protein [Cyanobacteriota bacterium]